MLGVGVSRLWVAGRFGDLLLMTRAILDLE